MSVTSCPVSEGAKVWGAAVDAWVDAIPEKAYDPCPCGCGEKFRFVQKDEDKLARHEQRFLLNFAAAMKEKQHEGATSA